MDSRWWSGFLKSRSSRDEFFVMNRVVTAVEGGKMWESNLLKARRSRSKEPRILLFV